ncbi:hypothetical protein CANTEDRAFT_109454 [Yamadazyma tenuis ATCC 10573]|uniref:Uncharacterized protein n=1 Tax=Candida tenuis (strain ATCC 10573 / BCRC 21748 / CBS 615 / JCM 9827 / NBRC 10315 / NRRL Y-1498 / VKM Y-70) TaxID=590646 RepID=G3B8M4_CANTC|nr:uncharacterized protein CANTEDRAFT_109454 [Yamadazyma tenuis ATCC 10573]EGV61768.1 hypothetical protein CANTEDRAFT_109454 [Yamadazyma tenuis ATCC 10573]
MSLYQRWMNLPLKARIYIGGSTFFAALAADYVLGSLETEVEARKQIEKELQSTVKK